MKQQQKKSNGRVAAFKRDTKPKAPEKATNSKRRRLGGPEAKIRDFVDKHFRNGIYLETADFAAENLCKAGVEPASLFDASTGAVTEKGHKIITEAVEEAWDHYLGLCKETYDEPVFQLADLLSDRTVLDFLMAEAAEQPWMAEARSKHRKTATVSLEETELPDPAPRPGLVESKPVGDLQSQFWLAKGIVRYPDPEGGASWADHYSYHLVEAGSAEQADELAMRELCPEAYEDHDDRGEWGDMDGVEVEGPIPAFYLGKPSAAVDAGKGFSILWLKDVTAAEYDVLKKRLFE